MSVHYPHRTITKHDLYRSLCRCYLIAYVLRHDLRARHRLACVNTCTILFYTRVYSMCRYLQERLQESAKKRNAEETAASGGSAPPVKRPRGRPKGSKNKKAVDTAPPSS
jgi:hypothetical protein